MFLTRILYSKRLCSRLLPIACIVFVAVAVAVFAMAEPTLAQFGLKKAAEGTGIPTGTSIPEIVGRIIKAALSLVGVIFLLMMLYAGFLWMTARGNQETATKAKDIISGAIIGIIIVASAYALTGFILGKIAGGDGGASSGSSTETESPACGGVCSSDSDCGGGTCLPPIFGIRNCLCS